LLLVDSNKTQPLVILIRQQQQDYSLAEALLVLQAAQLLAEIGTALVVKVVLIVTIAAAA